MQKSWKDKLSEEEKRREEQRLAEEEEKLTKSRPHIINLNIDPMLDRKVFYDLVKEPLVHVGRKNGDPVPQIMLGGIGIAINHAHFEKKKDGVWVIPKSPAQCQQIRVNGKRVETMEGLRLKPNDRIVFGAASFFLYKDPDNESKAEIKDTAQEPISYEMAEKEVMEEEDKY